MTRLVAPSPAPAPARPAGRSARSAGAWQRRTRRVSRPSARPRVGPPAAAGSRARAPPTAPSRRRPPAPGPPPPAAGPRPNASVSTSAPRRHGDEDADRSPVEPDRPHADPPGRPPPPRPTSAPVLAPIAPAAAAGPTAGRSTAPAVHAGARTATYAEADGGSHEDQPPKAEPEDGPTTTSSAGELLEHPDHREVDQDHPAADRGPLRTPAGRRNDAAHLTPSPASPGPEDPARPEQQHEDQDQERHHVLQLERATARGPPPAGAPAPPPRRTPIRISRPGRPRRCSRSRRARPP
ncbi:MAG: hypothetical protein KatS3mg014_2386 [Actinomycetota bacterium]|nr:MAG: hypothetical protein KatS3mg014_2386 [Actinomycetota bacterium]